MNETWLFIGVMLILYLYNDYHYRKLLDKRDEFIKDLEIKFMAKDVQEYVRATEEEPEDIIQEEDPYIEIDDLENIKTIEEIEGVNFRQ